jgi:hypothetical protein
MRDGGIITRLARHCSAHRAFRQSAHAKLTVPFDRLPRTPAGSTALVLDGYGLRDSLPARPTGDASDPLSVRQVRCRRSVPLTTMSTLRLPRREQTSLLRHPSTAVFVPWWRASSGSTWGPQSRHHTMRRTRAAAAAPRVIGGPGRDFTVLAVRRTRGRSFSLTPRLPQSAVALFERDGLVSGDIDETEQRPRVRRRLAEAVVGNE